MLNCESKLWKAISYNDGDVHIIQKSTGVMRTFSRSVLPSANTLAAVNEVTFDRYLRNAFHG